MHIVNVMFCNNYGGIEQSTIDYCQALKNNGHKVTAILATGSWSERKLESLNIETFSIKNLGQWDLFSKGTIKKHLNKILPDIVICHGNRAIKLIKGTTKKPIISVAHNYSIAKNSKSVDVVIAPTKDLEKAIIETGFPKEKIYIIPNMVTIPEELPVFKPFKNPPVIGALGRFQKEKGFDIFIYSMGKLKERGVSCKAIIGGNGEEEKNLKKLSKELQVDDSVEFLGYIDDKQQFFEKCDIFCLPSLNESFGIVIIEAFARAKPVIATDCPGPIELIEHEKNAIMVPKNNSTAISEAILNLVNNEDTAYNLSTKAYETSLNYSIDKVGALLSEVLTKIAHN